MSTIVNIANVVLIGKLNNGVKREGGIKQVNAAPPLFEAVCA